MFLIILSKVGFFGHADNKTFVLKKLSHNNGLLGYSYLNSSIYSLPKIGLHLIPPGPDRKGL